MRRGERTHRTRATAIVVALSMVVMGACGGDDDDAADPAGSADVADDATAAPADDVGSSDAGDTPDVGGTDDPASAGSDAGGAVQLGEPSLTADPGQVWAEVDGERLEYTMADSMNVECMVGADRVTVNLQANGHDFLLQGSAQTGDWFLDMTFAPGGDNTRYGADSMSGSGTFTVGDGMLSYEGTVSRVVDFDVQNAEDVEARVAVNCASPGGDPTAEVGGESFVFPLSGAQSVTCDVGPEALEIRINRLAIDGLQLELQGTFDGERWVGSATIYTNDGNYSSPLPTDGTGLTIDGTSVAYEGTFASPAGDDVEGSVSVTC
jgi:hypothetical protein